MKKAYILYRNFYSTDGSKMSIGGIQTYLINLSQVLYKQGIEAVIYQYADNDFTHNYNGIIVRGIDVSSAKKDKTKIKMLLKSALISIDKENDILIFGCETLALKSDVKRVIGIQHGISWDIAKYESRSQLFNHLFIFLKAFRAYRLIKRIESIKILVSVDYNFLNWYRSQVAYILNNVRVIPNSVKSSKINGRIDSEIVRILFARRFRIQRGTRLFSNVALKLLEKYSNIEFTFAGEGDDEAYLKSRFQDNEKIRFIKYNSADSHDIHIKHDIAVIPTIGSEGTSYSLLEAMEAGCAVVATNVGGMTNILLDEFNGLLVSPNESEVFRAIERLILDSDLRITLSEQAKKTINSSFNITLWEKKWNNVIEEINIL